MSRLLWVSVGAVGGIYAYRKGEKLVEDAKERGVSGNLELAMAAANLLVRQMRQQPAGLPAAGQAQVVTLPVSVAQQAGLDVSVWQESTPLRSA